MLLKCTTLDPGLRQQECWVGLPNKKEDSDGRPSDPSAVVSLSGDERCLTLSFLMVRGDLFGRGGAGT